MKLPIYLDNHSTTRVDPRVVEAMTPFFLEDFGNAASRSHAFGWRAEAAVEMAREELARVLGAAEPGEIVFTSGATESNNLALKGVCRARAGRVPGGPHVITVATEHPSVLDTCEALAREGIEVSVLPVASDGLVDPEAVRAALTDRTVVVSVMAANNEIGVRQPLHEIGRICREHDVLFHSDAVQALGKVSLDVEAMQLDLLSVTAHKLYGPKGIGALYVRRRRPRIRLEPLLHGGGHERGMRSGTLPVPLIVGFGSAVRLAREEMETEAKRTAGLRDSLLERLRSELAGVELNGHPEQRLPGNLHVSFEGVEADALVAELSQVAISTGSACSSADPQPSHVLRALGFPESRVRSGVRLGIGRFSTREEIGTAASALVDAVRRLRGE